MPSVSSAFSAAALAAGAFSTGAPSMWPFDVTVTDFEPVSPEASITVTVGWYVPAAKTCVVFALDCGPALVPSPKLNR